MQRIRVRPAREKAAMPGRPFGRPSGPKHEGRIELAREIRRVRGTRLALGGRTVVSVSCACGFRVQKHAAAAAQEALTRHFEAARNDLLKAVAELDSQIRVARSFDVQKAFESGALRSRLSVKEVR